MMCKTMDGTSVRVCVIPADAPPKTISKPAFDAAKLVIESGNMGLYKGFGQRVTQQTQAKNFEPYSSMKRRKDFCKVL